jgi:predicted RNase H-like HicB family nuclease
MSGLCYAAGMNEIIFEVREDETEGGFVARALGQSIVTQADTLVELRTNIRDAVRCHFEEGRAPQVIRLHRVLDEVFALA